MLSMMSLLFTPAMPAEGQSTPGDPPKGDVLPFQFDQSRIFPGTTRQYWVYVPRQYDSARPACVFVCQDAVAFNAPAVFDQLIAAGEMPVTIGVFIQPGRVVGTTDRKGERPNRSFEYDSVNDRYVRFLLEELLPDVETKSAPDGREIRLSREGNDRAIAGCSSGAIAAFTAAWMRPDAFTRVYSACGSFVNLRGGNAFPNMVRKSEPKPIRVFMQSGTNDERFLCGDWWIANQEMERALSISGYEVAHVWGEGRHCGPEAAQAFPDAMRWLWKDWPAPVRKGAGSEYQRQILIEGEDWLLVSGDCQPGSGLAVGTRGEVLFCGRESGRIRKIGLDGAVSDFSKDPCQARAMAFGPDGRLYVAEAGTGRILVLGADCQPVEIASGINGAGLAVDKALHVYVTEPSADGSPTGRLWCIDSKAGTRTLVDEGLTAPRGLALSADQSQLLVSDARSRFVGSYFIQPDGSLADGEPFYMLERSVDEGDSGAGGMQCSRDGAWLFTATALGVQMNDQEGRVLGIFPVPGGLVTQLCFGGREGDVLHAVSGGKLYRRKVKMAGANPF